MKNSKPKWTLYLTEVAITHNGKLVVGKRRIARYVKRHGAKAVVQMEKVDYAALPYRTVAKDSRGRLHLVSRRQARAKNWEVLS